LASRLAGVRPDYSMALYEMRTDRLASAVDERHPERAFFHRMTAMAFEVGGVNPDAALSLLIGDEPCLAKAPPVGGQVGNGLFGLPDQVVMPVAKDV